MVPMVVEQALRAIVPAMFTRLLQEDVIFLEQAIDDYARNVVVVQLILFNRR
jgi:branched-subunit amino acid transport protein